MHIYTIFSVAFVGALVTLTSAKTFDKEILVAGTHQVIEKGIKKRFSKSGQHPDKYFVARSSNNAISGSGIRVRSYGDDEDYYDDDDSDVYGEDRPSYDDDDDVYGEDRPSYYDDDDVYGEDRPSYYDDDDVYGDDRPSRGRYGKYTGRGRGRDRN
ncbi:hypothetical protein HPULCUR_008880 [Helicostylum pulchrum]|uniref:Uncharacterized protein n=1 Tax=Helicostylum pulchrum TaxID=562976 RepID=A0ABP9Y8U5_9FUNG